MRIDEFSALPDSSIDTTDITRFMTFGFDITISTTVSQFNYITLQSMKKYNKIIGTMKG